MSTPNAVPISAGLTQGDLSSAGEEVLLALMNLSDERARQVIAGVPRRFSVTHRVFRPELPQFLNMQSALSAAAFR